MPAPISIIYANLSSGIALIAAVMLAYSQGPGVLETTRVGEAVVIEHVAEGVLLAATELAVKEPEALLELTRSVEEGLEKALEEAIVEAVDETEEEAADDVVDEPIDVAEENEDVDGNCTEFEA